jgi:DNA-binding XRE family transcriptional regulator
MKERFEHPMNKEEFVHFRKMLNKTQKQMAQLLGTSIKAIHSYEQGWRSIPAHAERQVYFLASRNRKNEKQLKSCWTIKNCPIDRKERCPAWEFKAGNLCWFINGTICEGAIQENWNVKMDICRSCEILTGIA